jgi:CheY-like chemotaxis protein
MKQIVKILIADDSPTIQEAIIHMLENCHKFNFEICRASNGAEACKVAFKEHPDIILMDIEMPEMDGIKATQKIKSNEKISEIPIIVMSTSSSLSNAFNAGADDFIIKPFSEFELLLRLNVNIKLTRKTQELSQQNKLLQEQKQETEKQNELVLKQQKEILQDMEYASHIQKAINPSNEDFKSICTEYFVFNRPHGIVGGDFYWTAKDTDRYYIAVGDCTGHGTAGALMTMIGNAFLNEIITNIPYNSPGDILNELRKRIIHLLNQKGEFGEASNGMDIALCVFEPKTRRLEYAGANNPIYITRNNKELEIIKADRMPIGIYVHTEPFKTIETILGLNDSVYLFSDGYADQFGGPKGHKFRYKQFQELILENCTYPMNKQLEIITSRFDEWIDGFDQLDDVLFLGIKL